MGRAEMTEDPSSDPSTDRPTAAWEETAVHPDDPLSETRRQRLMLGLVILVALFLGWQLRWDLDDAYISFRYAWNLVHGHGLVFNPGENPPVEGYTNFLWTLLMAAPTALGLDPVRVSFALTLICGAATLVLTWHLARTIQEDGRLGLLAALLLGLNFTFLCFLTSGMETSFQALLVTACFLLALRAREAGRTRVHEAGLSLCAAAAVLTRLDSAVPVACTGLWLVSQLGWRRTDHREQISRLAWLVLPGGMVVGAWIVWKLAYYGDLLPNSWYAREIGVGLSIRWSRGLRFLGGFFRDYWYWPVILPALTIVRLWRQRGWALLTGSLLAWCLYVVHSGADYMEYRFMVPLLPALCVVSVAAVARVHRLAAPVAVAGLVMASAVHGISNPGTPIGHGRLGPDPRETKPFPRENAWTRLRDLLGAYPGGDAVLWTMPALGAPGYYTRFQLVDLHGLTDRWVARHGLVRNESPGHDKYAPLSYLERRGVALAYSFQDPCFWYHFYTPEELGSKSLVEIDRLLFLSVTPNAVIDQVVATRGARRRLPPPDACLTQQAKRRSKALPRTRSRGPG